MRSLEGSDCRHSTQLLILRQLSNTNPQSPNGRAGILESQEKTNFVRQEEAVAEAIRIIHEEEEKPEGERQSRREVCQVVEAEWQQKAGCGEVTVSHDTVKRRLNGKQSRQQFNMEQNAWLTPEEEEQIVNFTLDCAAHGLPLDHKSLKHHVDAVLHAQLKKEFPHSGVGKNWTNCFLQRHHACLQQFWSSPLDSAHGRAVNEHTNKAWFNLLGNTMQTQKIEKDCIWAADETGFQPGGGQTRRVIGFAKKQLQHQQRDGNRENITIMVTICADGEEIPPAIIYKGKSFKTSWHQGNSLRAS